MTDPKGYNYLTKNWYDAYVERLRSVFNRGNFTRNGVQLFVNKQGIVFSKALYSGGRPMVFLCL